ncbi:MAG: flagellar hook-basal body complex protein FliE [Actinomycetota bacterium]|nr:flagellar hook-basal body complex protein FliE [Actinomycetota bacterium]
MGLNPVKLDAINVGDVGIAKLESSANEALDSFSDVLKKTIDKVNDLQKDADIAIEKFVAGEIDIHDVMVEVEKANVALQLTIQLRNKVIEAYQEVMRMQI